MNKLFVILALVSTLFASACSEPGTTTMVTPDPISDKL